MLPPMSVPQLSMEAPQKSMAASPPVEPPGVYLGSMGFVVWPQRGLLVSHHCKSERTIHELSRQGGGGYRATHHDALREVCLGYDDGP